MLSLNKIKFNEIKNDDLRMILEWRNDASVRRNMKNKHVITFDEHKKWFNRSIDDISCEWLIVEYDGEQSGVVGIKEINLNKKTCTWGMYLSPNIKILGLGVVVEIRIIDRMFSQYDIKTIWGEVLPHNKIMMKIHKLCGFEIIETSSEIITISMERDGWVERKNNIIKEMMIK